MSADIWVGLWKTCDCIVAAAIDEPDHPKDTAKDVADFIRRGYRVSRHTSEEFRAMDWHCEHHPKGTTPPWRGGDQKGLGL